MDFKKLDIKIISFDIDGTLVKMEFNDFIWYQAVPNLVAQKENRPFEEAYIKVVNEYNKIGEHDLRWYDLGFWLDFFNISISSKDLLMSHIDKIKIFPEVVSTLNFLKNRYNLIVLTSMPKDFLDIKIKPIESFFSNYFSTISNFSQIKNVSSYKKVFNILSIRPHEFLHIGDHWEFDYLACKEAGGNSIFLNRDGRNKNHTKSEEVIYNLKELLRYVK